MPPSPSILYNVFTLVPVSTRNWLLLMWQQALWGRGLALPVGWPTLANTLTNPGAYGAKLWTKDEVKILEPNSVKKKKTWFGVKRSKE